MNPATATGSGLYVDEHQDLISIDALLWCEKRGAKWDRDRADAPPPKSRLLASLPNYIELTPWFSDGGELNAMDNDRDWNWITTASFATDWGKA